VVSEPELTALLMEQMLSQPSILPMAARQQLQIR
jgi:hypothetical protein